MEHDADNVSDHLSIYAKIKIPIKYIIHNGNTGRNLNNENKYTPARCGIMIMQRLASHSPM
jgi:hypothetical protein